MTMKVTLKLIELSVEVAEGQSIVFSYDGKHMTTIDTDRALKDLPKEKLVELEHRIDDALAEETLEFEHFVYHFIHDIIDGRPYAVIETPSKDHSTASGTPPGNSGA